MVSGRYQSSFPQQKGRMLQNRELDRGASSVCIADASQFIDRVYNIQSRPEASGQSEQCLLTLRESSFIKQIAETQTITVTNR